MATEKVTKDSGKPLMTSGISEFRQQKLAKISGMRNTPKRAVTPKPKKVEKKEEEFDVTKLANKAEVVRAIEDKHEVSIDPDEYTRKELNKMYNTGEFPEVEEEETEEVEEDKEDTKE